MPQQDYDDDLLAEYEYYSEAMKNAGKDDIGLNGFAALSKDEQLRLIEEAKAIYERI